MRINAASVPAGRSLEGRTAAYAIGGRRSGPGGVRRVMAEAPGLMRGKRGLIMGVANNRSIAWGIAKAATRTAPNSPSPIRAMR